VHHAFRVFQHLLTPKFEEVRRISVKLQTIFTVLSEKKEKQIIITKDFFHFSPSTTQSPHAFVFSLFWNSNINA